MIAFRLAALAALSVLIATAAVAQQGKQTAAQKAQAAREAAVAARQKAFADLEAGYKDKNLPRDVIEALFAINVDRAGWDRVQRRNNHSDQRLSEAARDTRDLGLKGRQNFEDIANSTREEIAALRRHAGLKAAPTKKEETPKRRPRSSD